MHLRPIYKAAMLLCQMLIVATRSLLLRQWDWRQRALTRSWKVSGHMADTVVVK